MTRPALPRRPPFVSNPDVRGRILIVEDETDLVEALEFQLRKAGHTVRVAENGNQALAPPGRSPCPTSSCWT